MLIMVLLQDKTPGSLAKIGSVIYPEKGEITETTHTGPDTSSVSDDVEEEETRSQVSAFSFREEDGDVVGMDIDLEEVDDLMELD